MSKRKKKSAVDAALQEKPSGKPKNHTDFMVWPVPRRIAANGEQALRLKPLLLISDCHNLVSACYFSTR